MSIIDALNSIFPTPQDFENKITLISNEINELESQLTYNLTHRPPLSTYKEVVTEIPAQLTELSKQTTEVRANGNQTLENVQKVTHKIKELDRTKENLSSSIRLLRQLRMLSKLYSQLDALLKDQKYEDLSTNVIAASDLIEYFRPFRPLPQIAQLSQEIGEMETKIYAQVESNLADAILNKPGALPSDGLRAACSVLDSLDYVSHKTENQTKLIEFYCEQALGEYTRIFTSKDEAGALENVERRFTYLKNKVINRFLADHQHFFPSSWSVLQTLTSKLLNLTADSLVAQIPQLNNESSQDIELFLNVFQQSRDFEKYLKSENVITSKLSAYLNMWVDFQDLQLRNRVTNYAHLLAKPDPQDEVFVSSKELISIFKLLLQQLFNLNASTEIVNKVAEMLAKHLGKYATMVLYSYLNQFEDQVDEDLRCVQVVNGTVDYIIQTTNQLIDNISTTTGHPDHIETVFEQRCLSKYRQVLIRSENLLCTYMNHCLDPQFNELGNQYSANKRTMIQVSKVSPYIQPIITQIEQVLRACIQASQTASVAQSVALRSTELICTQFLTTVMARVVKPLKESQVEQMLLDFGALKSQTMLKLIEMLNSCSLKISESRLKRLETKILETVNQCEAVLKVLMSSSDPTETFVMNYQLLVKDRSTLNFRKILDVKGIRYQPRAIEKFKMMASQDPSLVKENMLLSQIPVVPPPQFSMNTKQPVNTAFNFKKLGEFLRRET